MSKQEATEQKVLHATLAITYDVTDLSDAEKEAIAGHLQNTLFRQVGAGMLTDGTPALVESYSINIVTPVPMWFVRAEDEDGNNFDLILRAANRDRAIELWKQYFKFEEGREPQIDYVGSVPEVVGEGVVNWGEVVDPVKDQED